MGFVKLQRYGILPLTACLLRMVLNVLTWILVFIINPIIYLALYVDDILVCVNNDEDLNTVKDMLFSAYHMKFLGKAQSFLGLDIQQSESGISFKSCYLYNPTFERIWYASLQFS